MVTLPNMKQYLWRDRWFLDLAVSVIFAVALTTASQIFGDRWDGGQTPRSLILMLDALAVVSYTVVFFLGVILSKRSSSVRSWVWMSIVGALVYSVVMTINAIPAWLEYYYRFETTSGLSPTEYVLDHFPSMLGICGIFAALGALFLVSTRFIVGFIEVTLLVGASGNKATPEL
jgi:hypothetical protein